MASRSISIIIPTHNRARTIARAVQSALAGAPTDAEVIVVDDASEDGTREVLRGIADPRLAYERLAVRSNGNAARNRGAAMARSGLLAFLDSDDTFEAGRVGRLLGFFGAQPRFDAVADSFQVVHRKRMVDAGVPAIAPDGRALERLLVFHAVPLTCSGIAVRKTVFDEIGGFDPGLARQQDRDFLLRLARRHRVALGTGRDVVKYQEADSLSRRAAGYVASLDALVARHPAFSTPESRSVLAYLSIRMILRALFAGRPDIAASETLALARSSRLPGPARAMAGYKSGKRERKRLAAAAVSSARAAPLSDWTLP